MGRIFISEPDLYSTRLIICNKAIKQSNFDSPPCPAAPQSQSPPSPPPSVRVLPSSSVWQFRAHFASSRSFEIVVKMPKLVASNGGVFWGWFFLVAGSFSFAVFVYATVISKLHPPSNNSAIQNDWYYCLLVPLTCPILVVAVYFHWLSMKLFKHA